MHMNTLRTSRQYGFIERVTTLLYRRNKLVVVGLMKVIHAPIVLITKARFYDWEELLCFDGYAIVRKQRERLCKIEHAKSKSISVSSENYCVGVLGYCLIFYLKLQPLGNVDRTN